MKHLNSIYRDGFAVSSIPKHIADAFLNAAKADDFQPDKPGSPDVVSWEEDDPSRSLSVPLDYLGPMELIGLGKETEHIRAHMGDWSRTNVMLQRGKRGDSMGWHHDSYDPMQMVVIIYLSDEIWTPEDGGQLLLGEGDIDDKGALLDPSKVVVKEAVLPNHGTAVWLINTNPRWVHSVSEILCDKARYTLIGQFGYRENVMRAYPRKRYGDDWR
ncbi:MULTISPECIES: 2OG-Fe(II) oxygenase family protein [Pseudomonas syringae group]|uniref:2OG-Fe(II) oxygenase family protein n=1 Tax=Pseudomonas syringae group TaxID=136849 RepID=UPI000E324871|nr:MULTISPECIES: 2OG-Fe(II) oxygenase family protein [Pseudomonas syringae group]